MTTHVRKMIMFDVACRLNGEEESAIKARHAMNVSEVCFIATFERLCSNRNDSSTGGRRDVQGG